MKVKKYILIITMVFAIALGSVGSAFACEGGGIPPEDTATIRIEPPLI